MLNKVPQNSFPVKEKEDELRHILNEALAYAQSSGADAAQASVMVETGFSVQARNKDVETLEHHQQRALDITIFWHQQTGSATTSDLSVAAVRAAVDKARAIAQYANPDPFAGLADPELMAYHYPDLRLYHPWDISPADAIEMAIECETVACEQDKRILHAEGASISTYNSFAVYGNSHGFVGAYPTSLHTISCGIVASENEQMQRDHEYSTARRPEDLDSVVFVAKRVAEKTLARLGARALKTCQCPVIFYAPVAKSLLRHFVTAVSGTHLYRHETFLFDSLGKKVFPESIHIYQQPHILSANGSAPFDGEGVSTKNLDYVHDGIITNYIMSSYSARKLSRVTTGNSGGVFNLIINPSHLNLVELMRQMDTGFLVTELLGEGINMLSGDYSRGAAGFWVERGEIQFPVEQVTVAGNLKEMFMNLAYVGNDVDTRGSLRTGSILINQMTVAGK